MIASLAEILEKQRVDLKETVYAGCRTEFLDFKIFSGDFYGWEEGKKFLSFKNSVEVMEFSHIAHIIPWAKEVQYSGRDRMPYFTNGLESFGEALREGRRIAIEGGPCLFCVDEVIVEVIAAGGEHILFDYSTGSRNQREEEGKMTGGCEEEKDLAEYLVDAGEEVEEIVFHDRKRGLTIQEYESIRCLFEYAKALDAPFVIPIPDMSYMKYLKAAARNLRPELSRKSTEAFREIAYRITDLYLNLIDSLQKEYPTVECLVVHERNEELCRQFYERRKPFVERNRVIRDITRNELKLEAVKDYISMPALPFYLWGITDILQIDSQDETDSYRKCKKAHKGKLNLSCILYPERMSRDGIHTIFYAPTEYKEYVR